MKFLLMKCKKWLIAGAKVLHNRCIQMGKKFNCDIVSKSTFSEKGGTKICQQIESSEVKSIVKNEKLVMLQMEKEQTMKQEEVYGIYEDLLQSNVIVEAFQKRGDCVQFRIKKDEQNKVQELLDKKYSTYEISQRSLVKLSIVGYGITQDNQVLMQVMDLLGKFNIGILDINLTQAKIEVLVDEIANDVITRLHEILIKS